MKKHTLDEKFIKEIGRCTDPIIIMGLARILNVPLLSNQQDSEGKFIPRDGGDILVGIVEHFSFLQRERKREILKIIRQANQSTVGGDINAT